jgi:hypothetical protein
MWDLSRFGFMATFEPEAVYSSIPYRVLPDSSIEAMMPGGLVKFRNLDLFLAAAGGRPADANGGRSSGSDDLLQGADSWSPNLPAPTRPLDYYSILQEAIKTAKHNSSQLRALVYDRARFSLKRDILYGHPSMGLAELVQQVRDFELAVARIEANAVDDQPSPIEQFEPLEPSLAASSEMSSAASNNDIEILPATRTTARYAQLNPIQWTDNLQNVRWPDEFLSYMRSANRFIGFALLGMAFVGAIVIAVALWPPARGSRPIETADKSPQAGNVVSEQSKPSERNSSSESRSASVEAAPKPPFPLPTSFGIYALNNNKLVELEALPISVPDPRVALSAEIKSPSAITISDHKPAFILFRRDLLNNAPQKVILRVVARMTRETKIANGKPAISNIEGTWRVRDISRELKISPIAGQREMLIARLDDDVSLPAGRFALVVNRLGYDFTIDGPVQAPEFCLEGFETANGTVFTQCRTP